MGLCTVNNFFGFWTFKDSWLLTVVFLFHWFKGLNVNIKCPVMCKRSFYWPFMQRWKWPCPIYNGSFKALFDKEWIVIHVWFLTVNFNFGFSTNVTQAHFLFVISNGELSKLNAFRVEKNDDIFLIFDQIKVSRVPLWIGHRLFFAQKVT